MDISGLQIFDPCMTIIMFVQNGLESVANILFVFFIFMFVHNAAEFYVTLIIEFSHTHFLWLTTLNVVLS